MSNTILIKRSDVANSIPSAGNLVPGEMALNFADGNLFFKDATSNVVLLTSTQFVSVTGNVTGGNINTAGQVVASGNITGNYFIGNGSQLTGIDATSIQNGTSNVQVYQDGNVAFNISGTSNVVVVSTDSVSVDGSIDVAGNIKFLDSESNFAGFEAPASITGNVIYKLPTSDGAAGNVLVTDGAGNLSWTQIATGAVSILTRNSGTISVDTFGGFLTILNRNGDEIPVPITS